MTSHMLNFLPVSIYVKILITVSITSFQIRYSANKQPLWSNIDTFSNAGVSCKSPVPSSFFSSNDIAFNNISVDNTHPPHPQGGLQDEEDKSSTCFYLSLLAHIEIFIVVMKKKPKPNQKTPNQQTQKESVVITSGGKRKKEELWGK